MLPRRAGSLSISSQLTGAQTRHRSRACRVSFLVPKTSNGSATTSDTTQTEGEFDTTLGFGTFVVFNQSDECGGLSRQKHGPGPALDFRYGTVGGRAAERSRGMSQGFPITRRGLSPKMEGYAATLAGPGFPGCGSRRQRTLVNPLIHFRLRHCAKPDLIDRLACLARSLVLSPETRRPTAICLMGVAVASTQHNLTWHLTPLVSQPSTPTAARYLPSCLMRHAGSPRPWTRSSICPWIFTSGYFFD
jgi:hypothetical protein